jgi:hypothetical protein
VVVVGFGIRLGQLSEGKGMNIRREEVLSLPASLYVVYEWLVFMCRGDSCIPFEVSNWRTLFQTFSGSRLLESSLTTECNAPLNEMR